MEKGRALSSEPTDYQVFFLRLAEGSIDLDCPGVGGQGTRMASGESKR